MLLSIIHRPSTSRCIHLSLINLIGRRNWARSYVSIPHKLLNVALGRQHVPQKVKDLILDYYSNFNFRVSSGQLTSHWHQLEVV